MLLAALLGAAALVPPPAACQASPARPTLFHVSVPDSNLVGTVVVEIAFPETVAPDEFMRSGATARVVRFHRGTYAGASIFVSPGDSPPCAIPFAHGRRGIIVAHRAVIAGRPTLTPIWTVYRSDRPDQRPAPRPLPSDEERMPALAERVMALEASLESCAHGAAIALARRAGQTGAPMPSSEAIIEDCASHAAGLDTAVLAAEPGLTPYQVALRIAEIKSQIALRLAPLMRSEYEASNYR